MTRRAAAEALRARPDHIRCGVLRRLKAIGAEDELPQYPSHADVRALMARRGWSDEQALYWLNTTYGDGSPAQLPLTFEVSA